MPPEDEPNLSYVAGGVGFLHNRLEEVRQTRNTDLLFLGSSHAYRGFDTRFFRRQGFSCFNLGSSSQTPLQTKILLERYLLQLQPKAVVYAVDPSLFSADGVESAIDLIANDKKDYRTFLMALRLSNIMVYNTLAYSLMMDRINTPDSFRKKENMQLDTYVAGGFVDRELQYFGDAPHEAKDWPVRKYQLAAFESVLRQLQHSGAKCILVFPPITRSLYESYRNKELFSSTMKAYAPYYDMNTLLSLDDSLHFFDAEHLNQRGVQLLDEEVLHILAAQGFLAK